MILPVLFSRWLCANRWSMIAKCIYIPPSNMHSTKSALTECMWIRVVSKTCLIIRCPDHVVSIYQRYVSEIKSNLTHPITNRFVLNLINNLNWKISTVLYEFNWFINESHCYLKKSILQSIITFLIPVHKLT